MRFLFGLRLIRSHSAGEGGKVSELAGAAGQLLALEHRVELAGVVGTSP